MRKMAEKRKKERKVKPLSFVRYMTILKLLSKILISYVLKVKIHEKTNKNTKLGMVLSAFFMYNKNYSM